jgi:hypothetical protein
LATAPTAQAADPAAGDLTCSASPIMSVERRLRQLSLDLLGRPPTMDEYRAVQDKGRIDAEDVRALMNRDDFYERMKGYHRALLLSNVTAAVYRGNAFVSDTTDGAKPVELRVLNSPRGALNTGCDHFILQDECNTQPRQDAHAEPVTKICRDSYGVPLPVSFDYDPQYYLCERLDAKDATITDCKVAVDKGALADKLLYFCDMRRDAMGALHPNRCLPHPDKPATMFLRKEILDAAGRVTDFGLEVPDGVMKPSGALDKIERCTLSLKMGTVKGSYSPARGCLQREGYTMTAPPYWDATGRKEVTACAIDAQVRTQNPATLESCEVLGRFAGDRSCGCGPRFRRCEPANESVMRARIAAINEEPMLIADSVLRRDENYFNLLTTRRSFTNGVMSEMYRDNQGVGTSSISAPVNHEALPEMPYTMDPTQWREYLRGSQHAGVLTTASYLLRFPTQRARVNWFYEAFMCKHFAPPAEATLPSAEDNCNRENNLAKRCGCNHCHATIEPLGAHWGRFGERNASYIDPKLYTRLDPRCRDCALAGNTTCDGQCGNYVMQAYDGDGAQSLGLLKTYLYRTPEDEPNIEGGPRVLVDRMMQTGDLQRCAVKRMWGEFLGRGMSSEEEKLYLSDMVKDFVASGHKPKALIEKLVSTPAYWRID